MSPETIERLNRVNRAFYARHAQDFSNTRGGPWPGWKRLLDSIPQPSSVLDLGCGNGRFASILHDEVDYVGVDSSPELLALARAQHPARLWIEADATTPDFLARLSELRTGRLGADEASDGDHTTRPVEIVPWRQSDLVVAFGVLHHIPSFELRRRLLGRLRSMGRRAAVTFWRFDGRRRFERRKRPFASIGVDDSEVEDGDFLLAWREDSVRYCHHADDEEIRALIEASGMIEESTFLADGEGGDLNRYSVLACPER